MARPDLLKVLISVSGEEPAAIQSSTASKMTWSTWASAIILAYIIIQM